MLTSVQEAWVEVSVEVPNGWQELLAEVLMGERCSSAVIEAARRSSFQTVRSYYPLAQDDAERRRALGAALERLRANVDSPELVDLELRFTVREPEAFADTWKATWKPFRVGRFCVAPPWFETRLRPGDLRLELVPGSVFGTGRHGSTRSCLRWLPELVADGKRLVDVGTGTGILAVGAALLGVPQVFGFDVDPNARGAARELARRNGVGQRCRFETGGFELLREESVPFDALVANLYADLLQAQAPLMVERLSPGGRFLCSGIAAHRLEATLEALAAAGLEPERRARSGNWCTLLGRRVRP